MSIEQTQVRKKRKTPEPVLKAQLEVLTHLPKYLQTLTDVLFSQVDRKTKQQAINALPTACEDNPLPFCLAYAGQEGIQDLVLQALLTAIKNESGYRINTDGLATPLCLAKYISDFRTSSYKNLIFLEIVVLPQNYDVKKKDLWVKLYMPSKRASHTVKRVIGEPIPVSFFDFMEQKNTSIITIISLLMVHIEGERRTLAVCAPNAARARDKEAAKMRKRCSRKKLAQERREECQENRLVEAESGSSLNDVVVSHSAASMMDADGYVETTAQPVFVSENWAYPHSFESPSDWEALCIRDQDEILAAGELDTFCVPSEENSLLEGSGIRNDYGESYMPEVEARPLRYPSFFGTPKTGNSLTSFEREEKNPVTEEESFLLSPQTENSLTPFEREEKNLVAEEENFLLPSPFLLFG